MVTEDLDQEAVNAMALQMLESLNVATEATWRALMKDKSGMYETLGRQRKTLEKLIKAKA